MRTYGRVNGVWTEVTEPEYVLITTLIQVLKLILGESPFYANYGIPAQQSVIQQIFPDFYVNMTQQQFSRAFAALSISKVPSTTPTYNINLVTMQGTRFNADIAT